MNPQVDILIDDFARQRAEKGGHSAAEGTEHRRYGQPVHLRPDLPAEEEGQHKGRKRQQGYGKNGNRHGLNLSDQ